MPRGTTLRNVRVSDDLWGAAQQAADRRGENVSEAIRELLEVYVDTPDVVLESLRGTAERRTQPFPATLVIALGAYETRHGSRKYAERTKDSKQSEQ